jgi:hypothetical protein
MIQDFIKNVVAPSKGQLLKPKSKINIKYIKFALMCKQQGILTNCTCLAYSLDNKDYKKISEFKGDDLTKVSNILNEIINTWNKYKIIFQNKQYFLIKK